MKTIIKYTLIGLLISSNSFAQMRTTAEPEIFWLDSPVTQKWEWNDDDQVWMLFILLFFSLVLNLAYHINRL